MFWTDNSKLADRGYFFFFLHFIQKNMNLHRALFFSVMRKGEIQSPCLDFENLSQPLLKKTLCATTRILSFGCRWHGFALITTRKMKRNTQALGRGDELSRALAPSVKFRWSRGPIMIPDAIAKRSKDDEQTGESPPLKAPDKASLLLLPFRPPPVTPTPPRSFLFS